MPLFHQYMSSAISKHVKISIKGEEDNPVYNDNLFAAEIVYSNINTSSGNKTISIINKDKSTNTFTGNYSNIQLRFDNSLDYIYTKTDTSSSDYSKLSDGNYSEISIGEQQSNLDKTIQINQNNDPNNWQTKYQGNKQIGQILIAQQQIEIPQGIIYGAMTDITGNENLSDDGIASFNSLSKKPIAIAYFTHHWENKVEPFPKKQCDIAKAHNAIPFIRMNADEIPSKDNNWKGTKVDCASILSGKYDTSLQSYAQAAKDWAGTILAEIGTEVNAKFLGFSGEGPDIYKKMARKVITLFKQIAPNVKWVFHGDYNALDKDPKQWYPGDDLYDWIGTSMYGQDNKKGCIGSMEANGNAAYNTMLNTGNKPLCILEWGLGTEPDTSNTMNGLPAKFPKVKMLLYWNEKGSYDRRIDKSPDNLSAFQECIASDAYTSTYYTPI